MAITEPPESCTCPICTGESAGLQPEDLTILLLACAMRGDMSDVVRVAEELHNQYGTRTEGEVLIEAHRLALVQTLQRSPQWHSHAEA